MAAQEKPWGGRFKEATSKKVEAYTESISFDTKMYKQDIMGSKAHAVMLAEQGILTKEEAEILCSGLDRVLEEIESGKLVWKQELEDVHMNIETRLTELVGEVGKKTAYGKKQKRPVLP